MLFMSNICKKSDRESVGSSSLEDYLEAILNLSGSVGASVRVTDLSDQLGVSKPSASVAVKRLAEAGWVAHERYGDIKLTSDGRQRAQDVAGRHDLLLRFLRDVLGVEEAIAERDACRLEHDLSPETVSCLTRFVEFLTGSTTDDRVWNRRFEEYLAVGKHHADLIQGG